MIYLSECTLCRNNEFKKLSNADVRRTCYSYCLNSFHYPLEINIPELNFQNESWTLQLHGIEWVKIWFLGKPFKNRPRNMQWFKQKYISCSHKILYHVSVPDQWSSSPPSSMPGFQMPCTRAVEREGTWQIMCWRFWGASLEEVPFASVLVNLNHKLKHQL